MTHSYTRDVLAYHFVGDRLRDGRPVPPDGEWLVHDGQVAMCESGLHASRHPFDALQYAPGAILCLVECDEIIEELADKLVCRRRKIVGRLDATAVLRAFAREQARTVLHLWDAPEIVRRYLETGDETLRAAAGAAARDAAGAAVWAAARAAARAAVWAAARDAARDAARAAVWAAAGAAAWVDAGAAARVDFAARVDAAFAAQEQG